MQNWFPVEWSSQLKDKPLSITLNNTPIVLFKLKNKAYALLDRCPHRGAPLSKGSIKAGTLTCPYHGWCFNRDGSCQSIPGVKDYVPKKLHQVPNYQVEEKYGLIWVCQKPHSHTSIPEIAFSPSEKKAYLKAQVNSPIKDIIENALDPLHTHFVHGGFIRTDKKRQKVTVKMRVTPNKVEAEYHNESKQHGLIHKILSFGQTVEKSFGRYLHPSLFQIEFITKREERLLISGFLSPINEQCSKIFIISSTNAPIPKRLFQMLIKPLFSIALKQDKKILELRFNHVRKFGLGKEVSTKGDLFGPYLDQLIQGKEITPREYEVELYV